MVTRYPHINGNGQGHIVNAVIVQIVGRRHRAIGKGADMGLHLQMRAGPQFGKNSGDCVIAIFIQQRGQPTMAQIQRTHLRVQITIDRQRQTGIGTQDR